MFFWQTIFLEKAKANKKVSSDYQQSWLGSVVRPDNAINVMQWQKLHRLMARFMAVNFCCLQFKTGQLFDHLRWNVCAWQLKQLYLKYSHVKQMRIVIFYPKIENVFRTKFYRFVLPFLVSLIWKLNFLSIQFKLNIACI